ncbi:hypothetical protein I3271_07210 [Photobacterium leiognathi]|uniref:hypothetical protein n=1 Tax=Photobacterium leiognathi TaxID=553611 RepID=UPI001EDE0672|nr:hypothetical protein [Photobacterium leiognathi]MCG3884474.1 hypothetical protein [Photobacterium leiognathi]
MKLNKITLAVILATSTLIGCGGGDDGDSQTPIVKPTPDTSKPPRPDAGNNGNDNDGEITTPVTIDPLENTPFNYGDAIAMFKSSPQKQMLRGAISLRAEPSVCDIKNEYVSVELDSNYNPISCSMIAENNADVHVIDVKKVSNGNYFTTIARVVEENYEPVLHIETYYTAKDGSKKILVANDLFHLSEDQFEGLEEDSEIDAKVIELAHLYYKESRGFNTIRDARQPKTLLNATNNLYLPKIHTDSITGHIIYVTLDIIAPDFTKTTVKLSGDVFKLVDDRTMSSGSLELIFGEHLAIGAFDMFLSTGGRPTTQYRAWDIKTGNPVKIKLDSTANIYGFNKAGNLVASQEVLRPDQHNNACPDVIEINSKGEIVKTLVNGINAKICPQFSHFNRTIDSIRLAGDNIVTSGYHVNIETGETYGNIEGYDEAAYLCEPYGAPEDNNIISGSSEKKFTFTEGSKPYAVCNQELRTDGFARIDLTKKGKLTSEWVPFGDNTKAIFKGATGNQLKAMDDFGSKLLISVDDGSITTESQFDDLIITESNN